MKVNRDGQIKGKHLTAAGASVKHVEYFIRYDTGKMKADAVQGVVVDANSAKDAFKTLSDEIPVFRLLDIKRV